MLIRSFSIDHGEGSKLIGTNSKNVYFDTFSSAALQFYMHAKPKRRHKLQRQTSMLFGHPQCQDSRSLCKVSKSMPGTLSGEAKLEILFYLLFIARHESQQSFCPRPPTNRASFHIAFKDWVVDKNRDEVLFLFPRKHILG